MDDLYSDALVATLSFYTDQELQQEIIPLALQFSNKEENLTTKRIGAHILGHVATVITDKVFYKKKVWPRVSSYYIDFNYPLRKVICLYSEVILKLIIDL